MAKTTDLFPVPLNADDDQSSVSSSESDIDFESGSEIETETLDPTPYWSSVFDDEQALTPPIFSNPDPQHHLLSLSLDQADLFPPPLETLPPSADDSLGLASGFDLHEIGFGSDCGSDPIADFVWEEVHDHHDDDNEDNELVVTDDVGWELLLSISNVVIEEEGDYDYDYDYQVSSEQFDSVAAGNPPAAKTVVESLPLVVVEEGKNLVCAVCKDEVWAGKKVRRLPCFHCYHGDCILPWLEIRNTCPLCRFELVTDDEEYERWKEAQRRRGRGDDERYDLDVY